MRSEPRPKGKPLTFRRAGRVVMACFTVLLVAAFAAAQTSYYHPGWNLFTPQQDVQLGQEAEQQELHKLPMVHDAAAESYVNALGKKLSSKLPGTEFPFRFHIVNDKQINAFALPGGAIFVNRGAICAAQNEAQLAGVMAHEESHVALRHSTSMASKEQFVSMPIGILGGMLGGGTAGTLARLGLQMGAGSYFLHYSRGMESQADALGAQVMNDSGYDPHYMAQFFETLQKVGGRGTMQFLSDHPNPGNRERAIDAEIPTLSSPGAYHNDSSQFHEVQSQLCDGVNPLNQKSAARSSAPHLTGGGAEAALDNGGGVQTVKFQGILLRFPSDWRPLGQGTSELTLVPKDGLVTTHDEPSVVRGVIISTFDPSHRNTLHEGTQELVQQLQHSNPELRSIAGQHPTVMLAGVTGESVQLVNRNAEGQPEHDDLMTFPRSDGTLLYFIFIAPDSEFGRFGPTFDSILNSVKIAQ